MAICFVVIRNHITSTISFSNIHVHEFKLLGVFFYTCSLQTMNVITVIQVKRGGLLRQRELQSSLCSDDESQPGSIAGVFTVNLDHL